jgi:hypothetical protein
LKTVSAEASKSVPLVYWLGSKPAGLASEQYTRVVAAFAKGAVVARARVIRSGFRVSLCMSGPWVFRWLLFEVSGDLGVFGNIVF